ncbi:lin1 family [Fusarium albosuccineum]|uniref:Lin1 family n=1 Tax=Fusarium albosuccineum TaxID=1237068 RepID=A0A8H4NRI1_9HYPO|nr:lin1 family [Fusarium albosuccineum]
MASRYSAARPKRDGENFARTHHNEDGSDSKKVKFDVRNPSTLAPDAREDDSILDADVIGSSAATKRGAVNLDGYDSDSDNETFNARAENRKRGKVDILEQLDNYDAANSGPTAPGTAAGDDDDDDMFAADDGDADGEKKEAEEGDFDKNGRKKDKVRFLDADQIVGEETTSKDKGQIRLDEEESSDDEADKELAIQEEGVDEEVGAGGLKKNAPKVEAFNLKQEMEEGQFDQDGNYVRKGGDPDAVHDNWLEGLSKKEMKKAAEAHQKREAEARKQRLEEDEVLVSELLKTLILNLERAETPLEALARLGKKQPKTKKIPKWKLKKMNKSAEGMEIDGGESNEDAEQKWVKASIDAITDAADKLLSRDHEDIYDQERELLVREYRRETGEDWVEPEAAHAGRDEEGQGKDNAVKPGTMWEFRWADGRDGGAKQGPYDGATMKAWQDAGYFPEGAVEFRAVEEGREWTLRVGAFE